MLIWIKSCVIQFIRRCLSVLKINFPADSYADCPMKDYDAAIKFVNNWFLPYELQTKVQQLNSQTDLFDEE
jgi:ORF6C domain.